MSVYLDASILVSLISTDANTKAADAALRGLPEIFTSDFGGAEFASAISKRVRLRELRLSEAKAMLIEHDQWIEAYANAVVVGPSDVARCSAYLRRLDLPLRTPDALHIAIASRLGAQILSFDKQLRASARKLGVAVV